MPVRQNYYALFPGLMLLILAGSVSAEIAPDRDTSIVDFTFGIALLLAVWSIARGTRLFVLGWVLVAAEFTLVIAWYLSGAMVFRYLELTVALVFFSATSFIAARDVLFGGTIDMNRVVGAVCVYLMIGLVWAIVYMLLGAAIPQAFGSEPSSYWSSQVAEMVYYSFVTLTTLGYGDIAPESPLVRSVALLETLIGQMYIAILIAALVGIHIANRLAPKSGER